MNGDQAMQVHEAYAVLEEIAEQCGTNVFAMLNVPEMMKKEGFRPKLSQIQSRGKTSPYLPTKQRVLWFLDEHPDGSIVTEMLDHSPDHAIFRCSVSFPRPVDDNSMRGGPYAECVYIGHGSETKGDFGDYIEKAETKAIGRALANAGYGTEALDEGVPVDAAPPDKSSSQTNTSGASLNQQKQIVDLQQLLGIDNDVDLASITAADAQALIVRLRASLAKRG